MSEWHTRNAAHRVLDDGPAHEDVGQHPVGVLSSAVLLAARRGRGEDQAAFAARAGVAAELIFEAEDGTQPVWALPYDEFTALADAVAVSCPRPVFETTAACDLLLSCVLDGDQVLATDVLVEPCSQDLARALLRLAVTGELDRRLLELDHLMPPDVMSVLGDADVALLRERAVALAESESPDAWVGAEILAVCWGELL